jgi:ABC-type nitrate/sulfonate/bicarbonate transport system substrate-binding protein
MRSRLTIIVATLVLCAYDPSHMVAPALAQPAKPLPTITVSAFNPPSLGSYLPPIIKGRGLDRANGFTLEMAYKPSDTYQVDFASGRDQVGGSSTFISEARRASQGVEIICLFNVFDYFAAMITANPQIKTFKDLEGKQLAADTPTTLWAMGQWFLTKSGVDMSKVRVVPQGSAAMVVSLQANRVDAAFLAEPTYSVIMHGPNAGQLHSVVADQALWKQLTGLSTLPLLGVAVHKSWLAKNKDQAQALYTAYKQAVDWAMANPSEAAKMISEATKLNARALEDALKSGRLGLRVQPAVNDKDTILAALQLAVQAKQVEKVPAADTFFYTGLK